MYTQELPWSTGSRPLSPSAPRIYWEDSILFSASIPHSLSQRLTEQVGENIAGKRRGQHTYTAHGVSTFAVPAQKCTALGSRDATAAVPAMG